MQESTSPTELADQISRWLSEQLTASGADRFVVGLSGGIDSAVVAGLAARGVGSSMVLGVIMPSSSLPDDMTSARLVAETFQIPTLTIDLTGIAQSLGDTMPSAKEIGQVLGTSGVDDQDLLRLAHANLKPRLRMTTLYYVANLCRGMVLGTGNRSESMIGYFTKHGDGGVDIKPIANLYKRDVRDIARAIGVPISVIDRPPSAGLWAGQTDETELGITYEDLDLALAAIATGTTGTIDDALLVRVQGLIQGSEHKRQPAPVFAPE